jgi:uncharacterized protein YidB (DUF937 family)
MARGLLTLLARRSRFFTHPVIFHGGASLTLAVSFLPDQGFCRFSISAWEHCPFAAHLGGRAVSSSSEDLKWDYSIKSSVRRSAQGGNLRRDKWHPINRPRVLLQPSSRHCWRRDPQQPHSRSRRGGLDELINQFKKNGFQDVVNSWIGTGQNQAISPGQLREALGQKTVNDLSRQADTPQDDLLAQLSKYLPGVIDKLTPNGQLPNPADLRSDYRTN